VNSFPENGDVIAHPKTSKTLSQKPQKPPKNLPNPPNGLPCGKIKHR
jgi:hypothetical protein